MERRCRAHVLCLACVALVWVAAARGEGRLERPPADAPTRIHLRVNQAGYAERETKLAVAFAVQRLPTRFSVIENESGRLAFQGRVTELRSVRWGPFEHQAELDFSPLQKPGRYRIELGGAVSHQFAVATNLYDPWPDALLEFLRQQRCGHNPWLDADCHPHDGRTAYGPLPAGTLIDARGGWHDAADLLKYLLTSGNATADLLLAYRLNPRVFRDRIDAVEGLFNQRTDDGRNGFGGSDVRAALWQPLKPAQRYKP